MSEKRDIYKKSIIKQLYFRNTLSCAEISEKINKSLPLTTKILQELIKDEYVTETGYAPSSGGRRPLTYTLKADVLYIVSVAVDQYITRIAVMNMENRCIIPEERFELNLFKNTNALEELTGHINCYIERSGVPKNKIIGIGIGMPGFIDAAKGVNYIFFEGEVNIPDYIAKHTGFDVFIDNDSSLIALAELRFGKAIGKENAMVINIGWGIGLGLILHANLFRGSNGFAGEFSHLSLFTNDRLCSVCGKTGCLETETSLAVMVENAKKALQQGQTSMLTLDAFDGATAEEAFDNVIKAAKKGDKVAVSLFSDAGYKIGQGVAILIHLLNPEVIILSGRGAAAGKIWQAPIQQALNEHCIPRLAAGTEIVVSSLGNEVELIGSAALVMENFEQSFTNEIIAGDGVEELEQVGG